MENSLPKGWVNVPLRELAKVEWGNTSITKKSYVEEGYPAFSASGQDGFLDSYEWEGEAIVLSAIGARCGKCFFATDKWTAIKNTIVIQSDPKYVNHKLLYYYLNDEQKWSISGSGQPFITMGSANKLLIPFPPKNEQDRLVAKLDELMEKIDRSRARLERIPKILKRFRQSILSAAVSGKLTEEWRERNSNISSSKSLIEEIVQLRKAKNIKVKLNFTPIESDTEIPEKWSWTQLLNIADVIGGVTKGKKFNGRKTIYLPYLRVANVQDGYLDLTEVKTIEVLPEDLEKYRLLKDDILFTEGGDRDKLGRGTVWNNEVKNCIHQNHIFRARAFREYVLPEYISIYTKSENARAYFFDNASQTVNLASINLTTLANVPIAVPPYEEQKEIVRRVEQLFSFADKIEARYSKAKAQLDKLPQSLLAKAFRGELAPQDDKDEPASVLLERIKQKEIAEPVRAKAKREVNYELKEQLSMAAEPKRKYAKKKQGV